MESHSPLRRISTHVSDTAVDDSPAIQSASSSATSSRPHFPTGRTPSTHSLLAAHKNADVRKGAQTETSRASADRSSISMPPPMTKPSAERRLSTSLSSARPHRRSEDMARSPPASVKSLDAERSVFGSSPTAQSSTTAYDPTVVTTASTPNISGPPVLSPPVLNPNIRNQEDRGSTVHSQITTPTSAPRVDTSVPAGQTLVTPVKPDGSETALPTRPGRAIKPRSISSSRRLSGTASSKNDGLSLENKAPLGVIGVCALDVKARSRPSRQILTRLQGDGDFEVIVFGDKAILDEGMWFSFLSHLGNC